MKIDGELDLKRATEALMRWLISQDISAEDCVALLQYTNFEIVRAHPATDFREAMEFFTKVALTRGV